MIRRNSTFVLDVSDNVYEDNILKDDDYEDDEEKNEKVITGRMMFVSNTKSDLYENTKFLKPLPGMMLLRMGMRLWLLGGTWQQVLEEEIWTDYLDSSDIKLL